MLSAACPAWAAVGLSSVMGYIVVWRRVAGPVGVLGGVGAVVGRRGRGVRCPGSVGLWRAVGRSCCRGRYRGRAAGLGAAVDRGGRCLASSLAVIVAAGGPHAVGVLFSFGSLPQLHSRVSGAPAGLFGRSRARGLPMRREFQEKR